MIVLSCLGHFCPALSKAVKTMKKGEKVLLTVKAQCKMSYGSYYQVSNLIILSMQLLYCSDCSCLCYDL